MYVQDSFTANTPITAKSLVPPVKIKLLNINPHYPNTPTPTIQATTPTNPHLKQNTPKTSQTAELNCLNFKLAVPPHK